ncbi:hypothetical protein DYB32_004324 [Aphanomyces invadans]|uniref:Uncharacterized protein n=1 Tax=Aphanomyces invadans TaxID=157072 RepID=A0A3R6WQK2_9STRA|nr:hypothetical protein DYB32_004324 [Aphanomyces invadans]
MELVHGDIFRQIAGHLGTRDLKCISITCRIFSDMVHHDDSTLWKDQFYRRWNSVNFKLDRSVPCIVSEMVRREFNSLQIQQGQPYGPTFGCGDTVGCLLLDHSSIVYTLNGQAAGPPIPCRPTSPLFPVVGVDTSDAIEWNFGQNPFVFDVSPQWEAQDTNIDVLWAACRTATYLSDDSSDEDESWMHNAAMDGYNLTNDSDDSDPFIESMDELDWSLDSAVDSDDSDGEEM